MLVHFRRAVPACAIAIALHLLVVGSASANTGTILPLNQHQAGTEAATPVANGNFESHDGTNPTGWTPTSGEIGIGPTINAPANAAATGTTSVQAKYVPGADTDVDNYRFTTTLPITFDATKQYTLSAYVWNFGADPPGDPDWELALVELTPMSGSGVKNVALDWQTDDGLSGADGYFIHTTFDGSFFAQDPDPQFQGAILDVRFDAANSNTAARPRLDNIVAQFDNISITEAPAFLRPATNSSWKLNTGGLWTPAASWVANVVPNGKSDWATFGNTILADSSVTVDGAKVVGRLNFNSAARYTVDGVDSVTLDTRGGNAEPAQINVLAGSHTIAAPLHANVTTHVNVANAADTLTVTNLQPLAAGAGLVKNGAGRAVVNRLVAGALAVDGGTLEVTPDGGDAGTVQVKSLSITGGALQLNDNDLIVDYGALEPSPEAAIRQYVRDGRNGALTTGIKSTPGPTADDRVLAIADNAEWGKTAYGTFTIDPSTIVGKYTYFGDSNLDGAVTGDDYLAVDSNLGTGTSWIDGDFNMDGAVTGDDYLAIDTNLGKGTPTPLAFAELREEMIAKHVAMFGEEYLAKLAEVEANGFQTVPEPGAAGLLLAGLIGLGMRIRRRGGH